MKLGDLEFEPATNRTDLVAQPLQIVLGTFEPGDVLVAPIEADLADTAAFCEHYHIELGISVNCVVLEAKRADKTWYAACLVPATARADVNGAIRRHLDARKISFASMDTATKLSGMEHGGITPLGLPSSWPILVDVAAAKLEWAVIGSGLRHSKLIVPGRLLAALPCAEVLDLALKPKGDDLHAHH